MPRGRRGDGDDAVRRDTDELRRERAPEDEGWPGCRGLLFAMPALALACAAAGGAWGNVPGPWLARAVAGALVWLAVTGGLDWSAGRVGGWRRWRLVGAVFFLAAISASDAVAQRAGWLLEVGGMVGVLILLESARAVWQRISLRPASWSR
jgi:hypothetical protein